MANNRIYSPELNPDTFYDESLVVAAPYLTKHMAQYSFANRGRPWLQDGKYRQVWMTSDIKSGQFSSTFDPIIIELVNKFDVPVITLPALAGLPNKFYPDTFLYEYQMSLAGLTTGCYRMRRTLGSGDSQVVEYGDWEYISSTFIPETVLIEAWSSKKYDLDVAFRGGAFKYQYRFPVFIDYDNIKRYKKSETYRNQRFSSVKLSSKSALRIPVYFGMTPTNKLQFGLPSEKTNLIELIHELDNITYDGVPISVPDDQEFEYYGDKGFRLRGMGLTVETALNRYSRVREIGVDPNKKLIMGAMADVRVTGETNGQGSNNAVPFEQII